MRLLVADKLVLDPLADLQPLGVDVVSRSDLTDQTLGDALSGVGVLVVRSTRVTAEAIGRGKELGLIVRAGAGVNTIDVPAASARGIYVSNCPGKNAVAVAELTLGLILALDRRIPDAALDLRGGRWEKARYGAARGLFGRRIGIAGLGPIGLEVLARAKSFGLEPHAFSRSLTQNRGRELGVAPAESLEALAAVSDIFTVHLPLTANTRGAVNRRVLEALPDGAIVVNTARAEVFDYDALRELAPKKQLRVGLDVFPNEPDSGSAPFSAPLATADDLAPSQGGALVYGTPHIGASTHEAQLATAQEVARIVRAFLTKETVPNVVNVCQASPARFAIVVRMLDKVGALANTFAVLKRHGINVEEVANTVFDGAQATCSKLRVSRRPTDACLSEIAVIDEILHVDVVSLPHVA